MGGSLTVLDALEGQSFAQDEQAAALNLNGIGMFSLDATLGKTIALTEGKSLQLRVDATNILNHPTPSNSTFAWNARFTQIYDPDMSLGSGTFGVISSKGQHRTWQAKIRFQF